MIPRSPLFGEFSHPLLTHQFGTRPLSRPGHLLIQGSTPARLAPVLTTPLPPIPLELFCLLGFRRRGGGGVLRTEPGGSQTPIVHPPRPNPTGSFTLASSLACVPSIVSYNVRGLSFYVGPGEASERKGRVRRAIEDLSIKTDIVCLQETKLAPSERQALSSMAGQAKEEARVKDPVGFGRGG